MRARSAPGEWRVLDSTSSTRALAISPDSCPPMPSESPRSTRRSSIFTAAEIVLTVRPMPLARSTRQNASSLLLRTRPTSEHPPTVVSIFVRSHWSPSRFRSWTGAVCGGKKCVRDRPQGVGHRFRGSNRLPPIMFADMTAISGRLFDTSARRAFTVQGGKAGDVSGAPRHAHLGWCHQTWHRNIQLGKDSRSHSAPPWVGRELCRGHEASARLFPGPKVSLASFKVGDRGRSPVCQSTASLMRRNYSPYVLSGWHPGAASSRRKRIGDPRAHVVGGVPDR